MPRAAHLIEVSLGSAAAAADIDAGPFTIDLQFPRCRQAVTEHEAQRLTQKLVSMGITDLAIVYQDTAFGREFLADATAALKATGKALSPASAAVTFDVSGYGARIAADQSARKRSRLS